VFVMIDRATGLSIDPPRPGARGTPPSSPGQAPGRQSSEPSVNTTRPVWKVRRCPIRSPVQAESIRKLATTSVDASTIHCRPETGACRSRWIAGSATFTIVASMPTMSRFIQQIASTR